MAERINKVQRHASSNFFYFVAAALGISFSCVLVVLAWNNALRNETRDFNFNTIAVRNEVEANIRTADAIIANLASFVAADEREDRTRFAQYTAGSLKRYAFIDGMARIRVDADGRVRVIHESGKAAGAAVAALLTGDRRARDTVNDVIGLDAAVALAPGAEQAGAAALYLVQPNARRDNADGAFDCAVLSVDLAGLVGAQSIEPSLSFTLYAVSEGVAGRQRVFTRPASSMAGTGWVVDTLREESTVRFEHFSAWLVTDKALRWGSIDTGLVLVAAVLGVGVTLLLVALARAKDLQARELEARNRVIEEQVQHQTRELAVARDQALEASRVKSDFLASMSHEIRTPLNAIIGMAELLSESALNREQEKFVGVFRNAGEALLSLVNDILDLSKIEAEQLILENIEFDLQDIVEQAVDIYALKADDKGIELLTDIAPGVPRKLVGDPGRLRQVMLNLIGNAIKFTEHGEIVVTVRIDNRDAAGDVLHFEVRDSGIGVPHDKLESIFGSFTQVDSSITRRYGGTGLGLAICKRLVEMMGGRIWVESDEGCGSRFHFLARLAPAMAHAPALAVAGRGRAVLLISRHAPGARVLAAALDAWQFQCTVCDDEAAAATLLAEARQAGQPYSAVVQDIGRDAEADGLAKRLREGGDATPLVMLFRPSTVAAGVEKTQRFAGASYLVKPLKRAQLAQAMANLDGAAPTSAPAMPVPASEPAQGARILLVEDNEDNRMLIKAYLRHEPYEVVEAENGAQALSRVQAERFDVVLMDVQMPVMDGYAATRAIREWETAMRRPRTPIIALTANAIKEDMERSLAAGCDDHLTKPIKKRVLLDALRERLAAAA
jgi:signal transduction histidine kinase/DNA-binding response OmpR family regulator